jgi:hypothetical protein
MVMKKPGTSGGQRNQTMAAANTIENLPVNRQSIPGQHMPMHENQ